MFSSLRARLLVSYAFVICVCLVLVTVALILVARPLQERLRRGRLAIQVAGVASHLQAPLGPDTITPRVTVTLARLAERGGTRLLLVDSEGLVLADSGGEWVDQHLRQLPERRVRAVPSTGVTTGPDGGRLLYAAASLHPGWVLAVSPAPGVGLGLIDDVRQGLLVAAGISLVLSILLSLLITGWVARPMRHMARAAEAIAAGDYDYSLDIRQPREARALSQSMQQMARQLEANQRAMRELVANISHDLRTPLTSVQGFAQALVDGVADDPESRQRAAQVIHVEAARMVRMVDQISQLARIDAGQMILDVQQIDLNALLNSVVRAQAPVIARRELTLDLDLASLPPVQADPDRLAQVFTNLIDNAIKYNQAGGKLRLETSTATQLPSGLAGRSLDWVAVSISDTGQGIPASDLPRVFERAYRVDRSRAASQGQGLGLTIAREIIEAHGGYVTVESVEGLGTRFTVYLPVTSVGLS